jgi:gas vesicle protein
MKYFFAGFSIGAIVALALAPASGQETRQNLSDAVETVNDSIQKAKNIVTASTEQEAKKEEAV